MFCFIDKSATLAILIKGDSIFWWSLFYSATITTTLATTFYFYATTKIGADKASSFIFLVPLSASVGSLLLLDEIPVWNTIVGGVLGILAVYILNSKIGEKRTKMA